MPQNCKTLDELWNLVNELNKKHYPENKLMPILGDGKTHKPKIMFVLINPTIVNISSDPKWQGPRFPFIGRKNHWRVLHRAGLFDDELMYRINHNSTWTVDFANQVLKFLKKKGFYMTNIVKWTGHDAALPDSKKIKLFLPILEREIELIQPEYIVTFGLIPFENLTKQKIKLRDYYSKVMEKKKLEFYEFEVGSKKYKVVPCYFPVGRGDPKKAADILRLVSGL